MFVQHLAADEPRRAGDDVLHLLPRPGALVVPRALLRAELRRGAALKLHRLGGAAGLGVAVAAVSIFERVVKIGNSHGGKTVVTEGIKAGDEILLP